MYAIVVLVVSVFPTQGSRIMSTNTLEGKVPLWIRVPTGIAFSDIPLRQGGRLPEFIIIGAAKAGTTALNQYLRSYPQLYMCPLKEPHFFSTDLIYERGLEWYRGLYADANPGQLCGEASTSYASCPSTFQTPQRIYDAIPDVKLIYIVREPVARIEAECLQILKYSQYVLQDNSLPRSIDRLLDYFQDENNPLGHHPIRASEYIIHITQYLRFFKRDQLLVLFQSDLRDRPQDVLMQIFEFLGVEPIQLDINEQHNVNATVSFVQGLKAESLTQSLSKFPGYALAKHLLPNSLKSSLRSFALQRIQDNRVIEPMSNENRQKLTQHFKPFNQSLADFLGCRLPPEFGCF